MAKAQFHKNQRVYVRPVGTWAVIERIVPYWAKGIDEPIRVFYDLGLGREFSAEELQADEPLSESHDLTVEKWRIIRARNRQDTSDGLHHPVPGTHPVVITGETDWGGWRVSGAEYDLDPGKVERQARLIAIAPRLASFASSLVDYARKSGDQMPSELAHLAHDAQDILANVERREE